MEALGVNTHFSYSNVYKARASEVVDAILRNNFQLVRENHYTGVQLAKTRGLQVIGIAGNAAVAMQMLQAGADFLEGPNEFNSPGMRGGWTGTDWIAELKLRWKAIVGARDAHASSTGRRVPLVCPSFSLGNVTGAISSAKACGALPGVDYGNLHVYPGNVDPAAFEAKVRNSMPVSDAMAPGKPVILTEFGTWWAPNAAQLNATHTPTDPQQAAAWWPGYLDVVFNKLGFPMACIYEFADEVDKQVPEKKQEGWFGVVDKDLTDKPQTSVIRHQALTINAGRAQLVTALERAQVEAATATEKLRIAEERYATTLRSLTQARELGLEISRL